MQASRTPYSVQPNINSFLFSRFIPDNHKDFQPTPQLNVADQGMFVSPIRFVFEFKYRQRRHATVAAAWNYYRFSLAPAMIVTPFRNVETRNIVVRMSIRAVCRSRGYFLPSSCFHSSSIKRMILIKRYLYIFLPRPLDVRQDSILAITIYEYEASVCGGSNCLLETCKFGNLSTVCLLQNAKHVLIFTSDSRLWILYLVLFGFSIPLCHLGVRK